MKKIMMNKYGFIRWPEEDFSDDGSRFYAYRVGRVIVTKCTFNGEAYISASANISNKLPYEVYSKLPHYSALDKLNGVSIASLTDNDLFNLCEACLMYEKEYAEAENNIQMPTLEEIKKQCARVQLKRKQELADININFSIAVAAKVEKWEWNNIRDYVLAITNSVSSYDPDIYAKAIIGTSRSIDFCKPTCSELQDSFYYKWIMERINK
jgi:hypothetical protein